METAYIGRLEKIPAKPGIDLVGQIVDRVGLSSMLESGVFACFHLMQ
jgi:hypothetical protein